ncbi:MAG TPA: tyrosine-type recombinase/integrase [Enhygromyxa sp.]|nr:tyrosine-type recombinase/integrase [Enhygromyxa sp.]
MKFNPSEPRPYYRRGVRQLGRWEIDLRGVLDNGLKVDRQRRVFPLNPAAGKIGKRQAAAQAYEEWQRWNRHGQVLRPGETPVLPRTGAMRPGQAPTFAQFAPDFLEFCASPNAGSRGPNAPSSLEAKEMVLRLHLLPAFGSLRMDQLTRRDVDNYVIKKSKDGRAYQSVRTDVGHLRRMLEVAKSYELIDKIPPFRIPADRPTDVVALSPDEAARFSQMAKQRFEPRRAVLLELFLRTGLRCGEALALVPADFNLEAQQPTVRVSRSWIKDGGGYGPTKGRTTRIVPVVPKLAAEIDALLSERGISAKSTTDHPFSAERDTTRPLSHVQVLALVKKIGQLAETRPVHTHMLRHTFGTDCARRGVPLLTLKEWMGHVKVDVTMRYLHLAAPDHLRWAELLVA